VKGEIDPALSDLLDGMSSTINSTAEKGRVTTLIGHLVDQAALSGVLKALYDLRIPLLSVENLDEKRESVLELEG
jgi:hypothetical protein